MGISLKLLKKPKKKMSIEELFEKQSRELEEFLNYYTPKIVSRIMKIVTKTGIDPSLVNIKVIPPTKPERKLYCVLTISGYRYKQANDENGGLLIPCEYMWGGFGGIGYFVMEGDNFVKERLHKSFWEKIV